MIDEKEESMERGENLPFKEYLKLNAIMWFFCLVVIVLSYAFTDAGEIVGFLFGFLGIGFSVVSIYDWLFDKLVKDI